MSDSGGDAAAPVAVVTSAPADAATASAARKSSLSLYEQEKEDRGNWSSRVAFYMATLGAAVGEYTSQFAFVCVQLTRRRRDQNMVAALLVPCRLYWASSISARHRIRSLARSLRRLFVVIPALITGFGNILRFPSLCVDYVGGAFFVPFLVAMFILGIPLTVLEIGFGQYFQTGDIGFVGSFRPRLRGVGSAVRRRRHSFNQCLHTLKVACSRTMF